MESQERFNEQKGGRGQEDRCASMKDLEGHTMILRDMRLWVYGDERKWVNEVERMRGRDQACQFVL